ncbi:MAG TPA: glycosyltransferase [Gemmataceae bacterium]|nr:glycosyltransferase [Gemmataceae bacterium]
MKILLAHNYYQQPGGEDQCVAAEVALLESRGHEVLRYHLDNDAIVGMGRLELAARTVWSRSAYRELRELIRTQRPSIVHFHNTFPLISPAAYYAARAEGVPVVQTLHNFRLLCPNALFFRNGQVCEDCLGKAIPWPGVLHRCYRGSRTASAGVATLLTTHRALGTWRKTVDVYVALTAFSRRKFLEGGLPEDRVVVKSNFVHPDPGPGEGAGGYGVFVGRLSAEKGVGTLLAAWKELGGRTPLKIVGDGPLAPLVREAATAGAGIEWLGSKPLAEVYALIGEAQFLVLPSQCYENFPRVVVEAFAKGTPVIASRLGAMAEVVDHGRTGLHFEPGHPAALAAQIRRLVDDSAEFRRMREAARREYEEKYTADSNYQTLLAIYEQAQRSRRCKASPRRFARRQSEPAAVGGAP